MPNIIKLVPTGLAQYELRDNLLAQMRYFGIVNRGFGLSAQCFVFVGAARCGDIVDKNMALDGGDIRHWIDLIGFSRIDGYPMFRIPDGAFTEEDGPILEYFRKNRISSISGDGGYTNWFQDTNMNMENVQMLEDNLHVWAVPAKPLKKGKQIFCLADPYGEENWEDE